MKAKNNKEVRKGYFRFTGFLILIVSCTVCVLYGFMKTSSVEVSKILTKTGEYDRVYIQQLKLVESMDSVINYLSLLNTSPKINDLLLQNVISRKKMTLMENMGLMNDKDCKLYNKVITDLNTLLSIKDSLRMLTMQEEMVRSDLIRCVDENKQVSRKLSAGGLIFEKK